ncbi:MAG: 3-mercaptopropionate dioxygenase [Acidobacteriota bacterium]|jgi:predicted metal-dependent enzyme (double-stranded beta helix superfamily)|nr:3-mercaptopropionate dioxygenase [Acidobacteriota bacterium]
MKTQATVMDPLIDRLCEAVRLGEVHAITERIKDDLESFIPARGLTLPERFRQARPDRYARRLLYRDGDLGFTAVVMTWGPGQRTPLHDHAGIWCVEGVMEGEMEVTRYELLAEEAGGLYRFAERDSAQARAGSAGALIPPFEHHVLGNAQPDQVALTLHVYGGEMNHCDVFQPEGSLYRRCSKQLSYDE